MKKKSLLSLITLVLAMLSSLNAKAQLVDSNTGQVVWTGERLVNVIDNDLTDDNDHFVYFVEFKAQLDANNKERYVTQGGTFGVQGTMSSIGMRMQIVRSPNSNSYYQVITRIKNSIDPSERPDLGDRMSCYQTGNNSEVYLDRASSRITTGNTNYPDWTIQEEEMSKGSITYVGHETPTNVTVNTIRFQSREGNYIRINENGKLVLTNNANQASRFVMITEASYNTAMLEVTWGEIDLGVFVKAGEFSRDNKDLQYWKWGSVFDENGQNTINEDQSDSQLTTNMTHWHQRNQNDMCNADLLSDNISGSSIGSIANSGTNYTEVTYHQNFADYYAGEINNEVISLIQELDGGSIPNLVDGLYKFTAQALYFDGETGTTNNGVSYFIIKREVLDGGNVVSTTFERLPIAPLGAEGDRYGILPKSGVSAGYVFDTQKDAYTLNYFLEVNGNTRLTIGIEQTQAVGWTVIGNIHLYAHGKQALFINEDWEDRDDYKIEYHNNDDKEVYMGDPYYQMKYYENYDYPATVYYQRTLTAGNWTTICLPVSLTGSQVAQAFGDETLVSEFDKVVGSCIMFKKTVDIATNLNEVIIQAGTPYIIKPSKKSPDYTGGKTLEIGNGQNNHTVTINGNVYAIGGVMKGGSNAWQESLSTGRPYTITTYEGNTTNVKKTETGTLTTKVKDPTIVTDDNSGLSFVGSFYKKVISQDEVNNEKQGKSGNADYYVFSGGNMYHLAGTKDWNIWATYAYMYLPKGSAAPAKDFTMSVEVDGIEEISDVTEIEEVVANPTVVGNGNMYTLDGQVVSGKSSLPKGIYIKNGRKYVVK